MKIYIYSTLLMLVTLSIDSCKKDFLNKKPATNLNVPTTLIDLQLLLDNTYNLYRSPALGEVSADDYNMNYDSWSTQFTPYFANAYVWNKDIFAGQGQISDWDMPYSQVLYANVVLQQLDGIPQNASNQLTYNNIKGSALFMRAWMFFDLAQIFTIPYDKNTANSDLGIPLRLTADINVSSSRATVQATYNQILSDIMQAKSLLSNNSSLILQNRPSKASVYGLLSRVYLTMRDYPKAGAYADSALQIQQTLIDFNSLDTTTIRPFTYANVETIYQNLTVNADPLSYVEFSQGYSIDSTLYRSYEKNDLRKVVYFSVNGVDINKKFGYSGGGTLSNGIATDELYLTRAECYARASKYAAALNDLNTLLTKRWKTGTYRSFTSLQGSALLDTILKERRKELVMRCLRWNDIRRLNKEGYKIIPTRDLNAKTYSLLPNSPLYALPIPPDVVALSKIQQNNR